MIRFLEENEKETSRNLYETVFDDPDSFVDYYYKERICNREILVEERDGQICGMVHLCKKKMLLFGKTVAACYFYAVATKEEYRHQGIMSGLLTFAKNWAEEKGFAFCYLIPENPAVYKKSGFVSVGKRYKKHSLVCKETHLRVVDKDLRDKKELSLLSMGLLEGVNLATVRDEEYFKKILRQYQVEGTRIELLTDGRLFGYRTVNEGDVLEEIYPKEWEHLRLLTEEANSIMIYADQPFWTDTENDFQVLINEEV